MTDKGDDVLRFISCQFMFAVQMWMRTYQEKFDAFDEKLHQLSDDDEDDIDVMEWEEEEQARLLDWVTILDENPREVECPPLEDVDDCFGELDRMSLPDLPYNEHYSSQQSKLMTISSGRLMMMARNTDRRVVATMVMNRPNVLRNNDNPDAPSQSALNGDHRISSSWLHNYVCVFVCTCMETLRLFFLDSQLHHGFPGHEDSCEMGSNPRSGFTCCTL